jgi:hypothetical protein
MSQNTLRLQTLKIGAFSMSLSVAFFLFIPFSPPPFPLSFLLWHLIKRLLAKEGVTAREKWIFRRSQNSGKDKLYTSIVWG